MSVSVWNTPIPTPPKELKVWKHPDFFHENSLLILEMLQANTPSDTSAESKECVFF